MVEKLRGRVLIPNLDNRGAYTTAGDADAALGVVDQPDGSVAHSNVALTAGRNLDLTGNGQDVGQRFLVIRTGAGAFNLSVRANAGPSTLATLAAGPTWAELLWDGSAWILLRQG